MSQSTFSTSPSGFLTDEAQGPGSDGNSDDAPSGSGGRLVKTMIAVLALLAVVGAAWFFLLRADATGEPVAADTVTPSSASSPAVAPVVPIVPAPAPAPPVIDAAVGSDPFNPLIFTAPEVVADGTAGVDPATGEPAATGTTTGTGTTPTTAGGTAAPPIAPVDPGTTAPAPITVTIVDVADDNTQATIKVDTAEYAVRLGQVFATYFKALSFQTGKCVLLQYGDQQFAAILCEGESAAVQ